MIIAIERAYTDLATLGRLSIDGHQFCVTIEKCWKNNKEDISCISEGEYVITPHTSPSKGECYLVNGTFLRSNILIHIANFEDELEGCIAPGLKQTIINGKLAVSSSAIAFARLLKKLNNQQHTLIIKTRSI